MLEQVPETHREAAEEVRAHLVALRGGAPFLSPNDARVLVRWLDDGVEVSAILRALERADRARRKRHSRVPLSLGAARRHLGRPTEGALADAEPGPDPGAPPLEPLAIALRHQATGDPHGPALRELADRLEALEGDDRDLLARQAMAAIRAFLDRAWADTPEALRAAWRREACQELEGLDELVDSGRYEGAVEQGVRERLRASYPLLTTATVWDLLT